MADWTGHIEKVDRRLLESLITAIEADKINDEELPVLANFVLEKIDSTKNHEQLIKGLEELSAKWPIFDNIEELERGEVQEAKEDKVEQDVLNLAKNGRVEEAISLAKTMTEN